MAVTKRRALIELGMWIDLALCAMSLSIASAILDRPLWTKGALLLHHPVRQILFTVCLGFAWHCCLIRSGAYDSYRINGFGLQAKSIIRASTYSAVWTFVWLCLCRDIRHIPLQSLALEVAVYWILASVALLASRLAARFVTRFLRRRGRNLRNVMIVGSNRRAVSIAESLLSDASMGYLLIGFVDDVWHYQDAPAMYRNMQIGQFSDISRILRESVLDEVIISLPMASSYHMIREIMMACHQQGILVRCEGTLFDHPTQQKENLHARLITIHGDDRDGVQVFAKRVIDIVASSFALILFSPILLCTALAIKITSPGPVFFLQERLGLGKRRFKIFKFRTMVVNAEALMKQVEHLNETQGPTFKLKNDPRITPIGNFLRRTSLDELPQLINVLLGDMSLVGPRPLPLRDYRGFSEDWHRRRFSVKPGITCLWQVSGRNFISFERWMELDMDYIDRWSIWLDMKILAKTLPAVVKGSGAM